MRTLHRMPTLACFHATPVLVHFSYATVMSATPSPATVGRGGEAGGADPNDPRPKRGSVTSLLILSLFVFMMTNNGGNDDLAVRNQYKDALSSLEWQFGNYSAWLNGSDTTNFVMVRSCHFVSRFFLHAKLKYF